MQGTIRPESMERITTDALAQGDKDALRELLAEGRRKKEETEARTRRA